MPPIPLMKEDHISQVPALMLLGNLGWEYLTPAEALRLRGVRTSGVLLEGILEEQLRRMNRVRHKGQEYALEESNVAAAVRKLRDIEYERLVRTNEKAYDLLCLGESFQQTLAGSILSPQVHYIDWERPERNVYHMTEEFAVERAGRKDHYIPDIVLFVNGIPIAVIECKKSDLGPGKDPMEQAISQHLRNQKEDGIPGLFVTSQLLLAVSPRKAQYGTTGTAMKFWAGWRERNLDEGMVREAVNRPLSAERKEQLFADRFKYVREYFEALEAEGGREVTEQDRAIWSVCRPGRLLELGHRYILYDAGVKKIARYQQYYCVRKIMDRIARLEGGQRRGGVVWHTQGSGKSLTMVMLAKAIAMADDIPEHKVVLVTDRVDLDDQIYKTFRHCGVEPEQATTGANLVARLGDRKQRVITTVINKFEAAVGKPGVRNEDPNIFVLVDEGHRTQYGTFHAKMRKVLPNACYIGFTGTPVMRKGKDTVVKFGGLIDTYTITQAVDDKAVVPLLYEGRHVVEKVDRSAIDRWFDRITENLTDEQKADLKQKFSREEMLFRAEPVVKAIAWDISEHWRDNWQQTPFKAQLVAPRKETALLYKKAFDDFGLVKAAVLISGPDDREGEEDIYKENREPVVRFWRAAMDRYGTEKQYNRQLIDAFKHGDPTDPDEDAPEIIIVVDKLLTGFDAPCNTVLYLARMLREHTLLQAIARVNRLHDGKEFGFILDYRGVLENLDKALDMYGALPDFDKEDLAGTVSDVRAIIADLPQKHSVLWDMFQGINTRDMEACERHLADDARRIRFYERFSAFARTLHIALSTVSFLEDTPEKKVAAYKRDLKFFSNLRRAVRRRYAEVVDFSEYEPKIKRLLDTHLGVEEVEQITGAVDLFDKEQREKAIEESVGEAARADTIAHNTARVLEDKWKREDPAFYKRFSRMLEEVIEAFRQKRLQATQYLARAREIMDAVLNRTGDDVPGSLRDNDVAKAYFGCFREVVAGHAGQREDGDEQIAEVSLAVDRIIMERRIVNWTRNPDVQNQMRQDIEDHLFEARERLGLDLTFEEMDTIMDECLEIAKVRCP